MLVDSNQNSELLVYLMSLRTKENVLSMTGQEYHQQGAHAEIALKTRDVNAFDKALQCGANLNHEFSEVQQDPWCGSVTVTASLLVRLVWQHWIGPDAREHSARGSIDTSHALFLHASTQDTVQLSTGYMLWHTWGGGNYAVNVALNHASWWQGLLFCAMGYDVADSSADYYNCATWAGQGAKKYQEAVAIIECTKDPVGLLAREKLRKAYQFYQADQRGDYEKIRELKSHVDLHCLLWIVSMLGGWDIFQQFRIPRNFEYDKAIDIYKTYTTPITALVIAARFGREDVVSGLLFEKRMGAQINLEAKNIEENTALDQACKEGYFHIAKELHQAGAKAKPEQITEMNANYLALRRMQDPQEKALASLALAKPLAIEFELKHLAEEVIEAVPDQRAAAPTVDIRPEYVTSLEKKIDVQSKELRDIKKQLALLLQLMQAQAASTSEERPSFSK